MNRLAKGQRTQRKCADELRALGYQVEIVPHLRWKKDWFGWVDVIAISERGVKLIAVRTNDNASKELIEKISNFKSSPGFWITKEVWVWKDRKGWNKTVIE